MSFVATALVVFVALEHLYFMALEMWLWRAPRGLKTFGMTKDYAETTAKLAANQGLYNGFLAAGLIWSLFSPAHGFSLQVFFLSCVVIAGLFGAATVKPVIALVQAAPAALALGAVLYTGA